MPSLDRDRGVQGNSARQILDRLPKIGDPGPEGHVWRENGRVDADTMQQGREALAAACEKLWRGVTHGADAATMGAFLIASEWRHDPEREAVVLGTWKLPEPEKEKPNIGPEYERHLFDLTWRPGNPVARIARCDVEEGDYGNHVRLSIVGNETMNLAVTVVVDKTEWDRVVAPEIASYQRGRGRGDG